MTLALFIVVGLVLLAGAVLLGRKLSRPRADVVPVVAAATAAPAPTPASAAGPEAPPEEKTISKEERQEVLKRVDLIPNLPASTKERIYGIVEHSQNLQRMLTVTFETGRTRLSEKEAVRLVKESKQPAFTAMTRDPTAVFVVLGYADKSGDEKKNLQLSTTRAASVMDLLRKQCGVQNMIHTVPMGSPELFDPKDPAENRVAEIWTLQP
jgi:outer membrane protein OmpA-like peptidoglycan-associated protein